MPWKFFRPQLSKSTTHFLMKDMDIAVERLNKTMERKNILVYGIMTWRYHGCGIGLQVYSTVLFEHRLHIPDCYNEGAREFQSKEWTMPQKASVGLIIVLDCGIKAVEEIICQGERDWFHHLRPSCPRWCTAPCCSHSECQRRQHLSHEHLSGCG